MATPHQRPRLGPTNNQRPQTAMPHHLPTTSNRPRPAMPHETPHAARRRTSSRECARRTALAVRVISVVRFKPVIGSCNPPGSRFLQEQNIRHAAGGECDHRGATPTQRSAVSTASSRRFNRHAASAGGQAAGSAPQLRAGQPISRPTPPTPIQNSAIAGARACTTLRATAPVDCRRWFEARTLRTSRWPERVQRAAEAGRAPCLIARGGQSSFRVEATVAITNDDGPPCNIPSSSTAVVVAAPASGQSELI